MKRMLTVMITFVVALVAWANTPAQAAQITILVNQGALSGVRDLAAGYEKATGHKVVIDFVGVPEQAVTSGTAAQYGGTVALNATFDNWKRNVDYAILGYLTDTTCLTVGITGPDTGQLRVGGPGTSEAIVTADWFVENAKAVNAAYIPIVNAANIQATLLDVTGTTLTTTINVTLNVAELSGGPGGGVV